MLHEACGPIDEARAWEPWTCRRLRAKRLSSALVPSGDRLNTRYPDRRAQAGADGLLDIDAIAEVYWQIHRQHRSAWTHEIDLRPHKEPF